MIHKLKTRRSFLRSLLPITLGTILLLSAACSAIGLPAPMGGVSNDEATTSSNNTQPPRSTNTALPTATAGMQVAGMQVADASRSVAMNVVPLAATAPEPVEESLVAPVVENYGVNPSVKTEDDHLSTFAMDVDTASYTMARSYLSSGQLPPADAIRVEEFINYLPSRYEPPTDGSAFAIHLDAAPSPFVDEGQLLLRVGIQGQRVANEDRDPATLIFVIDISGSMDEPNRLGMVKETLKLLVPELRQDDKVGIVVYSDSARVVLSPTTASDQQTIISAIDSLHSEGSTYAEAGLRLGYEVALKNMQSQGITRIVLLSDGVANVGETGPDAILQTIRQGVEEGITLSTIGFGMGTYNDVLMEQLANDGNGNYFYVDSLREARRIFVNNLTSTLQVIGYDAKIQVDFNPDVVSEYRLLGYENRAVADSDFRNDTVDAGEVGAGASVTALYEIILKPQAQGLIATAQIRYQDATTRKVIEQNATIADDAVIASFDDAPLDFRLTAATAELAELLRGSTYTANESYADVIAVVDPMGANEIYAAEIKQMAGQAQAIAR